MTRAARHTRDAGVSLIEVMAALAIVALMGAVAVVMLDGRRTALDVSGERLVRALGEAREHALVTGEMIGFTADADLRGWRFYAYRDGRWQVMTDHPALAPNRLPEGLSVQARSGAVSARGADAAAPQVWFDPAGFDAPFTYVLSDDQGARRINRLDDGRLSLGAQDEPSSVGDVR